MEIRSNYFQELSQTDGTITETKYSEYYGKQLESAKEFQDFVCLQLIKNGIVLTNMSSKKYQKDIGENIQGFEIKMDLKFRHTGNIYIETHEKSNINVYQYSVSGIYRFDNTWIYVIGDYQGVYLMQKKVLQAMEKKGHYKKVENGTLTSKGFLFPVTEANKYFNYIEF